MARKRENTGNYVGRNIHAIRIAHKLSQEQLAAIAGVSQTAVSSWECGQSVPRRSNVAKIIETIPDLDFDDIFSKESGFVTRALRNADNEDEETATFRNVPVFSYFDRNVSRENLPIANRFLIPQEISDQYPDSFFLPVTDESLNRRLPNGCNALVYPTSEVMDGRIHAVCIGNSKAALWRVHSHDGNLELSPDSTDPAFKPMTFGSDDIDNNQVKIVGRVVWYGVPLDYKL